MPSATLSPASAAGCTGGTGVTVVVDYGRYGGVETGCAPDPGNGFSALSQAGFSVAQPSSSPGFVCRIDGVPPVEDDACVRTSPETAYWSYWQAAPGGAWAYADSGAGGTSPRDGDTEGWSFGVGTPPGLAPPPNTVPPNTVPPHTVPPTTVAAPPAPTATTRRPPAPAPPPATTSRPAPAGSEAAPDPGHGATATATAPTSGVSSSAGPTPPLGPTAPSGQPVSPSTGSTGNETTAEPDLAAQAGSSSPVGGGGFPWSVPAAAVVVAALGTGAWWQIRRRG